MINKDEYPDLYKEIERSKNLRIEWLAQTIKAGVMCEFLPEEIKKLRITSIDYSPYTGLDLGIRFEEDTIRTLRTLGIQGLNPKVSSFNKNVFYAKGKGTLPDGTALNIHVSGLEEPEGCIVKEERSWSKNYVLVCEGTNEEIK